MNNKFNNFFIDSEKIKIINYIVVSDSDISYISEKNKNIAKNLKYFYIFFNLLLIVLTFYPFFLIMSDQKKNLLSIEYAVLSILTSIIFIVDYILRWITFPFRNKESKYYISLLKFPITGVSIILIFATIPIILSSFFLINQTDQYIRLVNLFMIFRLGRIFLLLNTFYAFKVFGQIIGAQKVLLINTFFVAILSFFIFAVIIYNVEVESNPKINDYWDAFYFTIICVTTIGFGDIYPVTDIGRAVTMILSVIGIIIFSIPTGIIAGSVIEEIKKKKNT